MRYRLAIFDFDGTLADSFPFFVSVFNQLAERHNFKAVAPEEVQALRQYSAREVMNYVGLPAWRFPMVARSFMAMMKKNRGGIPLFEGINSNLDHLSRVPEVLENLAIEAGNFRHAGKTQELTLNDAAMSLHRISGGVDRQSEMLEQIHAGMAALLQALGGSVVAPLSEGLQRNENGLGKLSILLERHLDQTTTTIDMVANLCREVQISTDAVKTAAVRGEVQMYERSKELFASIEHIGNQSREWSASLMQGLERLTRHDQHLQEQRSLVERQINLDTTRVEAMHLMTQSISDGCIVLADAALQVKESLGEYRRTVPQVRGDLRGVGVSIAKLQVGIADLKRAVNAEEGAE